MFEFYYLVGTEQPATFTKQKLNVVNIIYDVKLIAVKIWKLGR